MMRWVKVSLVTLMAAGLLTGCGASSDFTDIESFMKEVDSRPKGRIEPLPPIETVPPFAYKASSLRSPFEPPVVVKPIDQKSGPQVTPNFNRVKQYLEQFTIASLAMVVCLSMGSAVVGVSTIASVNLNVIV